MDCTSVVLNISLRSADNYILIMLSDVEKLVTSGGQFCQRCQDRKLEKLVYTALHYRLYFHIITDHGARGSLLVENL